MTAVSNSNPDSSHSPATSTALVVVDVQNDFCPGGALGTERGNDVAVAITELVSSYELVVATQDWHIDPGTHFSTDPNFTDTWPVHCVAGTPGAEFHPALADAPFAEVFRKGEYTAAYSGFEGAARGDDAAADNARLGMAEWLRERGIGKLDVVGIATDHCVRATVLDGLREGFDVTVLERYCSPVNEAKAQETLAELREAGARVV